MTEDYQAVFNEKTMTALEEMAAAVVRCAKCIQQSEERVDNLEQAQNRQIALNNRVVEVLEKINRDLHQIEQRLEDLEQAQESEMGTMDKNERAEFEAVGQYRALRELAGDWADTSDEFCKTCGAPKGGCPKCDGTGWITQYNSVPMPFGSGNVQMPSDRECECWTGESPHCPRCGNDNLEWSISEEFAHCLKCGWSSEDCESTNTTVIYPYQPDDVDYTHTNLSQFR